MMVLNVLIMQTLLMKPFPSVIASAHNAVSGNSWSDRKMVATGRKLTGIGIKKSSSGNYITRTRAR